MILLLPYTFIQLCHHISQISFVLQQIEFYEFPGGRRTTLFHTFCIFINSEFCTWFHKSLFAYLFWYVNVIVNLKHLSYFWKIHISTTRGPTAVWTRIEMCRDFFVKHFVDQIILPIRNQMVGKVWQWYLAVTWVLYCWLLLVFGSRGSERVKIWPRMGLVYIYMYTKLLALEPSRGP